MKWLVTLPLCAVLFQARPLELDPPRILPCRHRHSSPGAHASMLVAEHPRGVLALMEVCNSTSSAISVDVRPASPFLHWDAEPTPLYVGSRGSGQRRHLPPGRALRFSLELMEYYALDPREYYQCHYENSEPVGFSPRLTD
jgi:hypothetical protein